VNRRLLVPSIAAAISSAAILVACGGKSAPVLTPTLPGDGSGNTAPPPPVPTPTTPADPWAGRTDLIQPPAPPPPEKLTLPPVERFTLPNGLEVMVVASDKLPTLSLQLAVRAGRDREPLARLGTAELTANLLVKGTKKKSAAAIAKAVDFVGATLATDATFEATVVSCSVLIKDAQTCLTLLPEVITQPAFDPKELGQMKAQMIAGVRSHYDSASQLAFDNLQNLLWGDEHVRGWILDQDDLELRTRQDVVDWHATWFTPGNSILTVAGAVDPKTIKAQLTKAFGGWKAKKVPPAPIYPDPKAAGIKIRLVDMPGQTQAQIRIGQLGIAHDDPAFFDTLVWNYALGGGQFSSRLMKVLRSEGGKTYGASTSFDRNLARGAVVASTFTRSAETVATIKLLTAEIAKMAASGPTAEEVTGAISNLAGAHAMRFQSAGDVASALLQAELHDFGTEYLENFGPRLAMVTPASAAEAAARILSTRDYALVIVGDGAAIGPQLDAAGWRYQKLSYATPIGTRPGGVPAATSEPAGATDATSVATAKTAIEAAIKAKGGQATLAGVKSLTMAVGGIVVEAGQSMPVQMSRTVLLPNQSRVDMLLGGKVPVAVAIDNSTGWQASPKGVVDIPAADVALLAVERWREPELVLLRAADAGAKLALLPSAKIDGRPHTKVRITSKEGFTVVLWIDDASKLISRMSYDDDVGNTSTDDFSDYRDVGGIQVAHKRTSSSATGSTAFTVAKAEFNPTVDASIFKKPTK
jgi:zinc protease